MRSGSKKKKKKIRRGGGHAGRRRRSTIPGPETQPRKQRRLAPARSFASPRPPARTHARTKRIRFPGWTHSPNLRYTYKTSQRLIRRLGERERSELFRIELTMNSHEFTRTRKDSQGRPRIHNKDSQGLTRTHKDSQGPTRTHKDSQGFTRTPGALRDERDRWNSGTEHPKTDKITQNHTIF